jgi:predicted esterase YcpF (UPF0227 family)
METLFLHGFNSGPVNHSPDWYAPQLDYSDVQGTLTKLEDIIREQDISYIVAKSIGAFFALVLYQRDPNLTLFLINPSLEPHKTLKHLNGKSIRNYRDVSMVTKVPENFTDELELINPYKEDENIYYTGVAIFEFGDEVVDQVRNAERINCMEILSYPDGNHSFTRMPDIVKYINTFIKYAFAS